MLFWSGRYARKATIGGNRRVEKGGRDWGVVQGANRFGGWTGFYEEHKYAVLFSELAARLAVPLIYRLGL